MPVKNQVQLITYPDSLGGNLKTLDELLAEHFAGAFGGVHILPPFPSSGDRGFAPLTYAEIDPRFGTWEDLQRIAARYDVLVDLMVNHMSRRSPYFQDFLQRGRSSAHADLFITLDKVWPGGEPEPADVARISLRRPHNPFSTVTIEDTGERERIWTTFGRGDPSEQIDLDIRSSATRQLLAGYLEFFAGQGIRIVRLDAVGYVVKKAGTSCFMVEPEIYAFIDWLQSVVGELGLELLPEVHTRRDVQARLAEQGYWVYDFALPGLVVHALNTRQGAGLRRHLQTCPRRQFTMLDCHDGIPVLPDLDGILSLAEMQQLVNVCLERGANLSRLLAVGAGNGAFDAHQINCTYYAALDCDDDAYVAARALQLFAPGIPQVYYVGLLAGENDAQAAAATGEGRAINRHNYSAAEVEHNLRRRVVQRLLWLIRLRSSHPAFAGDFTVADTPDGTRLVLGWRAAGQVCRLHVDLKTRQTTVTYTDESGRVVEAEC